MRLKYKTRLEKLDEISNMLPDGKFIAVFGTSHTSGVCKRGESENLALSDYWCKQLSDLTGYPVFNASMPGNDNETIIQQLIDFFDTERSSNAVHILVELRVNEGAFRISRDLIDDFSALRRQEFYPQLKNCHDIGNELFDVSTGTEKAWDTINENFLARIVNVFDRLPRLEREERIRGMHVQKEKDYEVAEWKVDLISDMTESYRDHVSTTMLPYIEDYNRIKTMSALCRAHGVKFNWFCWDEHIEHQKPSTEYRVVKNAFTQVTDVFDTELNGLETSVVTQFNKTLGMFEKLDKYKCDCGHYIEDVHHYVAQQITKEILQ
jgi:hypothetical protein